MRSGHREVESNCSASEWGAGTNAEDGWLEGTTGLGKDSWRSMDKTNDASGVARLYLERVHAINGLRCTKRTPTVGGPGRHYGLLNHQADSSTTSNIHFLTMPPYAIHAQLRAVSTHNRIATAKAPNMVQILHATHSRRYLPAL